MTLVLYIISTSAIFLLSSCTFFLSLELPESFYKISKPVSVAMAKYSCVWLCDIPFTPAGVSALALLSFIASVWDSLYCCTFSSSIIPFFVCTMYLSASAVNCSCSTCFFYFSNPSAWVFGSYASFIYFNFNLYNSRLSIKFKELGKERAWL